MMKKHITIILVLCLFVGLTGCTPAIKTYTGKKLTKLSFSTIEYMGGNTREYILDFESNVYSVVVSLLHFNSTLNKIKANEIILEDKI